MTIETESSSQSKASTLHPRRRIVSDTIIPQALEAKIRMNSDGIRKRKVVLPTTFKITENYIKNQIDGLIPKQTTLRKRKTRHLHIQPEIEQQQIIHPVLETVQAILSEPEPTPISFPHPTLESSETHESIPFHAIESTPVATLEIPVQEPILIPILRNVETFTPHIEIADTPVFEDKPQEIIKPQKKVSFRKFGLFLKKIFTEFAKRDPRRQSPA